jgi:hypothetical protein
MKKNNTRSKKSGSSGNGKSTKRAAGRKKGNEVSSDPSLQSSLTSDVGMAPVLEDMSEKAGQAGDVQGISNLAEADPESVEELLEDGQALEAEVVSGVEDAPDEREVPKRKGVGDETRHSFEDRNKL